MTDDPRFEADLIRLLEIDTRAGVRAVDPYAVARELLARPARRWTIAWPQQRRLVLAGLLLLVAAVGGMVAAALLRATPSPAPTFTVVPLRPMAEIRDDHAAVVLGDGRVLIAGGNDREPGVGGICGDHRKAAEIFDPTTGTFGSAGDLRSARAGASATLMDGGRVLIVGAPRCGQRDQTGAEWFDPGTGTSWPAPAPIIRRRDHAAIRLPSGILAIIGGTTADSDNLRVIPTIERYDPATDAWRPGPSDPLLDRMDPSVIQLDDGRVLVVGGRNRDQWEWESDRAVFEHVVTWNPANDRVEDLGSLPGAPFAPLPYRAADGEGALGTHVGGALRMSDGAVLMVLYVDDGTVWTVQRFDPGSGSFTVLGRLPGRPVARPVRLGSDRMLVAIEDATDCTQVRAVAFDPSTGASDVLGPLAGISGCRETQPTMTALEDGSVLVTGGLGPGPVYIDAATLVPVVERARRPV